METSPSSITETFQRRLCCKSILLLSKWLPEICIGTPHLGGGMQGNKQVGIVHCRYGLAGVRPGLVIITHKPSFIQDRVINIPHETTPTNIFHRSVTTKRSQINTSTKRLEMNFFYYFSSKETLAYKHFPKMNSHIF